MNKREQHEQMYRKIREHGEMLNVLFRTELDPVQLSKKLFQIENQAHRRAEDYCNGVIDADEWDQYTKSTLRKLDKILDFRTANIPVFINADPRGHALKIESEYTSDIPGIYRDWGGYGILAPDFNI